ncbi:hypothetical protein CRYUN_Cryun13aG0156900 [Craigia yunnanensis]
MAANVGRIMLKGKGKVKAKGVSSVSSQLGKFLGIPAPPPPPPPRNDTAKLIFTFIKINNRQVAPVINPYLFYSSLFFFLGLIAVAKASSASFASSSASNINGSGLMRVMPISPQLGKFLGASEASRTVALKKIWDYIKLHKLQNPANKKEILCDEKLKMIFAGKDTVGMFEITKLHSPHFVKSK